MKKLKLKALELGAKEVLTREQLKMVLGGDDGGSGSGSCGVNCNDGTRQSTDTCVWDKVASICDKHDGIKYGFNCTCP